MNLHFENLHTYGEKELRAAATMISAFTDAMHTTVAKIEAAPAAVVAAVETKVEKVEAEVEKATRRKSKNAEAPASAPAAEAPKQAAPAASAPIGVDELRAALQRYTAEHGLPAGIPLLNEFGCARISELADKDEATKQAFLAKCPPQATEAA